LKLEQFLSQSATREVSNVVTAVAAASIVVWESIPANTGLLSQVNPSGEKQTAIDVVANDSFVEALRGTGSVAEVASEEMDVPARGGGKLSISMDPLDGSSNIETNNPVGSIFGVYNKTLPASGSALVASAFVTYGPMVTLTLSLGSGVYRFVATREGSSYDYQLMDQGLRMPDRSGVYGFGGLRREWTPGVRKFVETLEERGTKLRYCGTFVGDYNQLLKHGGIFSYPALKQKPRGKLRILYETAPIAFITRQAGGLSSDGVHDILDLEPKTLAETSPAYIGSPSVVRELEAALAEG